LLPGFPYWSCLEYLLDSRSGEDADDYVGIRGAGVGNTRNVRGLFAGGAPAD
jgi:hypothetical protein